MNIIEVTRNEHAKAIPHKRVANLVFLPINDPTF